MSEVCACLDKFGERKVEIVERCVRCGHATDSDYVGDLIAALEKIAAQQQKTLAMIRTNGFVFTNVGREPGNWQHLAFSIYTDLCEVDTIARSVLGDS